MESNPKEPLHKRIASKFGNGPVAQQAAIRALRSRARAGGGDRPAAAGHAAAAVDTGAPLPPPAAGMEEILGVMEALGQAAVVSGGRGEAELGSPPPPADSAQPPPCWGPGGEPLHSASSPVRPPRQQRTSQQQAPVKLQVWDFDPAHPALAATHYLRTADQNEALKRLAARREAEEARLAAKQALLHTAARPETAAGSARHRPASGGALPRHSSADQDLRPATAPRALPARAGAGAPDAASSQAARQSPPRSWGRASCPNAASGSALGASSGRRGFSARCAWEAAAACSVDQMTAEELGYVQGLERRIDTLQHSLKELSAARQPPRPPPPGQALPQPPGPVSQGAHSDASRWRGAHSGDGSGWAEERGGRSDSDASDGGSTTEAHTRAPRAQPSGQQPPPPPPALQPVRSEGPAPATAMSVQPEDELRIACAAFDAGRFAAFTRETDAHMARRRSAGLARASAGGAARAVAASEAGAANQAREGGDGGSSGSEDEDGAVDAAAFAAGFESDLEREAAAREAAKSAGQRAAEAAAARRKAALDAEAARRARWQEENAWMDAYRPAGRAATDAAGGTGADGSQPGAANADGAGGLPALTAATEAARGATALPPAAAALLAAPFVPVLSAEWPQYGAAVDAVHDAAEAAGGVDAFLSSLGPAGAGAIGGGSWGPSSLPVGGASPPGLLGHRRPGSAPAFRTTVAAPFGFETRAAAQQARGIMAVKADQDRGLKWAEAAAARRICFHAKPVPPSTLEPRYEAILAAQAARREAGHDACAATLAAIQAPFSFHERDRRAAEEREARRREAKDPNRFQRRFKAHPVPESARDSRFASIRLDAEARRVAARVRAEAARERVRARLEGMWRERREAANAAYRERLAATAASDPGAAGSGPAGKAPSLVPGPAPVPDFASLHGAWERRLAAIKASNRRSATVPQAFSMTVAEERARREARAAIAQGLRPVDSAADASPGGAGDDDAVEQRWPFTRPASRKGGSTPGPAPAARPASAAHAPLTTPAASPAAVRPATGGGSGQRQPAVGSTLAARLRAEATRHALEAGLFESPLAREQRRMDEERAEARRRQRQRREQQAAAAAAAAGAAVDAAAEDGAAPHASSTADVEPPAPGTSAADRADASCAAGSLQPAAQGGAAPAPPSERPAASSRPASAARSRGGSPHASLRSPTAVAARRAALEGRTEAPAMHVEARHAQAAARARELVEAVLRAQGCGAAGPAAGPGEEAGGERRRRRQRGQ
ncbi:hypothetical protein Rsub_09744 [Raphidocelis subcapitata]|uniref:Uncharacterized protein n=1 Tax=Raphidocelis subcapitata TaxID=307507 RepID=A0A2V0PCW3_9CHLO|nr:hypothetical protein Rsub_09744 [Raphidocelis subcapitata]|eukprot:GBF97686.1 hypothetical protein Rsub_09744 [Raphidocelis subcapitata]